MIKRASQMNFLLDHTDVSRLMCYHDRQFIQLSYKTILDRDPDTNGLDHYLHILRDGESRREIIFQIASSEEARLRGITTDVLGFYLLWRRIQRVPVFGSLLLIFIFLFRIRIVIREFRRIQNAVFGMFSELK